VHGCCAQADLALANLARLRGLGGAPQRHVWYGDPHLDTSDRRHEVEVRPLRLRLRLP
jgi:hypothetical protein